MKENRMKLEHISRCIIITTTMIECCIFSSLRMYVFLFSKCKYLHFLLLKKISFHKCLQENHANGYILFLADIHKSRYDEICTQYTHSRIIPLFQFVSNLLCLLFLKNSIWKFVCEFSSIFFINKLKKSWME